MDSNDAVFSNERRRQRPGRSAGNRSRRGWRTGSSQITAETVAIFPYSGAETLDGDYCRRLGHLLAQLLAFAVRDGRLDPRGEFVADLHRVVVERALPMERLPPSRI